MQIDLFPGFSEQFFHVNGNRLFARVGGPDDAPPLAAHPRFSPITLGMASGRAGPGHNASRGGDRPKGLWPICGSCR